jgi:hypothetical protein
MFMYRRVSVLFFANVGIISSLACFASASGASDIAWRSPGSATGAPTASATGPRAAASAIPLLLRDGSTHFVVRLAQPVNDSTRAALQAGGVTLLRYLGTNSFFASASPALSAPALSRVQALAAVQPIQPGWKLHPLCEEPDPPPWTIVEGPEDNPVVGVYVLLHADVPLDAAAARLSTHGGTVRALLNSVNGVVAELPWRNLAGLACEDDVQWIEPALPRMSETNSDNRLRTGADIVQEAPYGLSGAGVTVLVYDGGVARANHVDFGGRLTVHDGSSQITHATHVAGTIGGSGQASSGLHRGMAPAVTLLSYGLQTGPGGIFLYTNPGDLEQDYAEAFTVLGADISNNSIGTNVEINGFPCSMQGDYGVTDGVIDALVRGSMGAPFRVIWAGGNERQDDDCDVEGFGDYYSTAPPAGAKNHVCVGALNSNDDSMTSFSSWGPVDDGRLKPDVTAPGCQSTDDKGVTSCSAVSTTAYTVACGTSMASPTVCGLAALLLEDYRAHFPGPDPRNSTLKILFAHNAVDLGNPGPDYQFGYGSVRIQPTIDFLRLGHFAEATVGQGGAASYVIDVPPGTPELRVTLAWDDFPATPNIAVALVNDLDLRVTDPGGTQHFPWTLNPLNPAAPAVQTQADHINNIEQVLVKNPAPGTWKIKIVGTSVPEGPQPFSVCATPNLVAKGVQIDLTSGAVTMIAPGSPTTMQVSISAVGETVVPGSEHLRYRFGPGPFALAALTSLGGSAYEAVLPSTTCLGNPEFYLSVEGSETGLVTNPLDAPEALHTAAVGAFVTLMSDDFETDSGWTVGAPDDDAERGIWNRMNPQPTDAQPGDDHTPPPGVICWVTDGNAGTSDGSFDVDGGKTTLFSPLFDLSGAADPVISYWRWYSNDQGGGPNNDIFVVDITADGATWKNVETIGPAGPGTSGGWLYHEFHVSQFIPLSPTVQLRFVASDEGVGSLVEAALDDFAIVDFACDSLDCPGDFDGDGQRNQVDLGILLAAYESSAAGDLDGDGFTGQADLGLFLAVYDQPCR